MGSPRTHEVVSVSLRVGGVLVSRPRLVSVTGGPVQTHWRSLGLVSGGRVTPLRTVDRRRVTYSTLEGLELTVERKLLGSLVCGTGGVRGPLGPSRQGIGTHDRVYTRNLFIRSGSLRQYMWRSKKKDHSPSSLRSLPLLVYGRVPVGPWWLLVRPFLTSPVKVSFKSEGPHGTHEPFPQSDKVCVTVWASCVPTKSGRHTFRRKVPPLRPWLVLCGPETRVNYSRFAGTSSRTLKFDESRTDLRLVYGFLKSNLFLQRSGVLIESLDSSFTSRQSLFVRHLGRERWSSPKLWVWEVLNYDRRPLGLWLYQSRRNLSPILEGYGVVHQPETAWKSDGNKTTLRQTNKKEEEIDRGGRGEGRTMTQKHPKEVRSTTDKSWLCRRIHRDMCVTEHVTNLTSSTSYFQWRKRRRRTGDSSREEPRSPDVHPLS